MTGFGVKIPQAIDSIQPLIPISREYILTNTEFKFDTVLAGFEYYVSVVGTFIVYLNQIAECGTGQLEGSCGDFFLKNKFISYKIIKKAYTLNPQSLGLNFFWIDDHFPVPQGSTISLLFNSNGRVAMENLNESYFEDYYFNAPNIIQIDSNKKFNFLFNALTAHDFFYSKGYQFNKTYGFEGTYNITILNQTKTFNVTSCKYK